MPDRSAERSVERTGSIVRGSPPIPDAGPHATAGTVPAPLIVIPGEVISDGLACPSIRMRVLGNRGVAIPVVENTTPTP